MELLFKYHYYFTMIEVLKKVKVLESMIQIMKVLEKEQHFKKENLEIYMMEFLNVLPITEMTFGMLEEEKFVVYNLHERYGLFTQNIKASELSDWEVQLRNEYYIEEQNKETNEFARIYGYFDQNEWVGFIRFLREEKEVKLQTSYQLVTNFFEIYLLKQSKRELLKQIKKVELTEPMTRLKNRIALSESMATKIKCREPFTLIRIKIEGIRRINDIVGFTIGDEILKRFAHRLRAIPRVKAYRISGTEFALRVDNLDDEEHTLQRVIEAGEEPIKYLRHRLKIDVFIGVVRYPENGTTLEQLEFSSMISLDHSKISGKNKVGYFVEELKEIREEQDSLEQALERAIEHDEIDVYFQAQYSLKKKKIDGLEALARWKYNGKMIPPNKFIPLAETSGMILDLGYNILRKVCLFQRILKKLGYEITIAVNISVAQLIDEDFVANLQQIINQYGISKKNIELEITESISLENQKGIALKIEKLKEIGFKIVMDDFGTGYASMTYLKRDIYHKIKVDRYFIKDIGIGKTETEKEQALLTSIIKLIQSLNMPVLVEGVETDEQLNLLEDLGCDYIQGFLYSKPMNAKEMLDFIQQKENEGR